MIVYNTCMCFYCICHVHIHVYAYKQHGYVHTDWLEIFKGITFAVFVDRRPSAQILPSKFDHLASIDTVGGKLNRETLVGGP